MSKLATTYGKTWHVWDTRDKLPLGIPKLMMEFTGPGQVNPELQRARDARFGRLTEQTRANRQDIRVPASGSAISAPGTVAGSGGPDAWQDGSAPQLELTECKVRNAPAAMPLP